MESYIKFDRSLDLDNTFPTMKLDKLTIKENYQVSLNEDFYS